MTARGPGGRIAPDGRPPRAKGVGKNARRHDLEAPATPGLHGSDLQQGDVQMMEQGQRVAPRPKRQQAQAAPQPQRSPRPRTTNAQPGGMQVPDPISFAAQKVGGGNPMQGSSPGRMIDPTPWVPLLRNLATRPNSGGALAATLTDLLMQYRRRPVVPAAYFIDQNEMDAQIARNL